MELKRDAESLAADRAFQERLDRAILDNHECPDEWLVVVTDADGDRIASETFGGDYGLEQIKEQALHQFNLAPGQTLRFYPIGIERVDLAIRIG